MKEMILGLIDASVKEYQRYCKSIERPSLHRFMDSIIDHELQNRKEVENGDESFFDGFPEAAMKKEIQACSASLRLENDVSGLREVMEREEAMAELFAGCAKSVTEEKGRIFFSQLSLDERKHAGLVRSRLELESLI